MEREEYFLVVLQEGGKKTYSWLVVADDAELNLAISGQRAEVVKALSLAIRGNRVIGSTVYNYEKVLQVQVRSLDVNLLKQSVQDWEMGDALLLRYDKRAGGIPVTFESACEASVFAERYDCM